MPFEIIRNDITNMRVDAIVNTANPRPMIGSGVDAAIHAKAGPMLLVARKVIGTMNTGEACITPGFKLPCKHVIHTVGPVWHDGGHGEAYLLRQCYAQSLKLARRHRCKSVAFPLISAGNYGFPKQLALQIAVDTIREFLEEHEMQVYLVVFSRNSLELSDGLVDKVRSFIDDAYVQEREIAEYSFSVSRDFDFVRERLEEKPTIQEIFPDVAESSPLPSEWELPQADLSEFDEDSYDDAVMSNGEEEEEESTFFHSSEPTGLPTEWALTKEDLSRGTRRPEFTQDAAARKAYAPKSAKRSSVQLPKFQPKEKTAPSPFDAGELKQKLKEADAGFSETLLKLIDKSGEKDSDVYKRANVDRKLFSKIRNNPQYKPSKATAVAFAIALELDLEETRDFIGRAGYALSRSNKFDIIIEYFITHERYDIYEINLMLFEFDQSLLGA